MMGNAGRGAIKTFEQKKTLLLGGIQFEMTVLCETMQLSNNSVWLMILGTFSPASVD
jgi:hypothetical protein